MRGIRSKHPEDGTAVCSMLPRTRVSLVVPPVECNACSRDSSDGEQRPDPALLSDPTSLFALSWLAGPVLEHSHLKIALQRFVPVV